MWQELSAVLSYCPKCGVNAFHPKAERLWVCGQCDFHFYLNIASAVGGLVLDEEGRLLVTRRAMDPGKGLLGLPGGFLEIGETAEEGLRREIREEVGLEITEMRYLASFTNTYHYRDLVYPTLDFFFICRSTALPLYCDPVEIACAVWMPPAEIDLSQIAFASIRQAIEAYKMML